MAHGSGFAGDAICAAWAGRPSGLRQRGGAGRGAAAVRRIAFRVRSRAAAPGNGGAAVRVRPVAHVSGITARVSAWLSAVWAIGLVACAGCTGTPADLLAGGPGDTLVAGWTEGGPADAGDGGSQVDEAGGGADGGATGTSEDGTEGGDRGSQDSTHGGSEDGAAQDRGSDDGLDDGGGDQSSGSGSDQQSGGDGGSDTGDSGEGGDPSGLPTGSLGGRAEDPEDNDWPVDPRALVLADYVRDLLEEVQSDGRTIRQQLTDASQSGLSYTYYDIQPQIDALISLYQATYDTEFLEFALELCMNMLNSATYDLGDGEHPIWDGRLDGEMQGDTIDTFLPDLQGSVPLARIARVILLDPDLAAVYGQEAAELAAFVDEHILCKWYDRGLLTWMYQRQRWVDKLSLAGRLEADLARITPSNTRRFACQRSAAESHASIVERLAEQYRTVISLDPARNAYFFAYEVSDSSDPYNIIYSGPCADGPCISDPDSDHMNRELPFVLAAAEAGVGFSEEDVRRWANTVTQYMWNGSLEDPLITNFHDGRDVQYLGRPPGSGIISAGWILGGLVDTQIQQIGQAILDLRAVQWDYNNTVKIHSGIRRLELAGHLALCYTRNP